MTLRRKPVLFEPDCPLDRPASTLAGFAQSAGPVQVPPGGRTGQAWGRGLSRPDLAGAADQADQEWRADTHFYLILPHFCGLAAGFLAGRSGRETGRGLPQAYKNVGVNASPCAGPQIRISLADNYGTA